MENRYVLKSKYPEEKHTQPERITDGFVFGFLPDRALMSEISEKPFRAIYDGGEVTATVQEAITYLNKHRNPSALGDALIQILKQAREEYEAQAAELKKTTTNNGGEKEMSYKNFESYLEELQNIFNTSRAAHTQLQDNYNTAKENWKAASADYGMSETGRLIEKAHYLEAEEKFNAGMLNLQTETKKQVQELRAAMQEHLHSFYSVTPEKLDAKTMELLKTGILNDRELEELASANRGNPAMLRVIGSYAAKIPESRTAQALCHKASELGSGEKELEIFDNLNVWLDKSIQPSKYMSDGFAKEWPGAYSNAISSVRDLYAVPQSED